MPRISAEYITSGLYIPVINTFPLIISKISIIMFLNAFLKKYLGIMNRLNSPGRFLTFDWCIFSTIITTNNEHCHIILWTLCSLCCQGFGKQVKGLGQRCSSTSPIEIGRHPQQHIQFFPQAVLSCRRPFVDFCKHNYAYTIIHQYNLQNHCW